MLPTSSPKQTGKARHLPAVQPGLSRLHRVVACSENLQPVKVLGGIIMSLERGYRQPCEEQLSRLTDSCRSRNPFGVGLALPGSTRGALDLLSPGADMAEASERLRTFASCGKDTLNAEQFGAGPGSCIMELNIKCCLHQGGNISDLFEPGKNASYWYGTCLAPDSRVWLCLQSPLALCHQERVPSGMPR